MALQPNLFDRAEVGPVVRARVATPVVLATPLADGERPADWREPSTPERVCGRCGGDACFGQGAARFCYACRPADFLPRDRGEVAA